MLPLRAHGGCDRSAEDAYSSMAPDPTFALSEVRVALHSILYMFIWIMITFDTMLTSPFYIFIFVRSVFELRHATYRQVVVAGISIVTFKGRIS